jgi:dTMP kinase
MTQRGKLIALEGIDGSGKRTQLDLLACELNRRGLATAQISFPRYETPFGKLVARYLNGEFGPFASVDPHFSAMLYAANRLEAKPELDSALATGKIVLADRYIGSNLAHQTGRVDPQHRDAFMAWLKHLEYTLYGLPVEDLVVYLSVPAPEAQKLVGLKATRSYTTKSRDLHEADVNHLEQTAKVYNQLATAPNWARIDCINLQTGVLYSPEKIHQEVIKLVETRVLAQASRGVG